MKIIFVLYLQTDPRLLSHNLVLVDWLSVGSLLIMINHAYNPLWNCNNRPKIVIRHV